MYLPLEEDSATQQRMYTVSHLYPSYQVQYSSTYNTVNKINFRTTTLWSFKNRRENLSKNVVKSTVKSFSRVPRLDTVKSTGARQSEIVYHSE